MLLTALSFSLYSCIEDLLLVKWTIEVNTIVVNGEMNFFSLSGEDFFNHEKEPP